MWRSSNVKESNILNIGLGQVENGVIWIMRIHIVDSNLFEIEVSSIVLWLLHIAQFS